MGWLQEPLWCPSWQTEVPGGLARGTHSTRSHQPCWGQSCEMSKETATPFEQQRGGEGYSGVGGEALVPGTTVFLRFPRHHDCFPLSAPRKQAPALQEHGRVQAPSSGWKGPGSWAPLAPSSFRTCFPERGGVGILPHSPPTPVPAPPQPFPIFPQVQTQSYTFSSRPFPACPGISALLRHNGYAVRKT